MKAIKIILIITFLVKTCNLFAQGEYCFECEGNTSRGLKSSTFGVDNHALGDYSNVFGQSNMVRGKWATAFGFENSSNGDCSFVAGRASSSLRNYSAVIGSWSTADGLHSFVIGSQSKSLENYGYVFGRSSKVQNTSAMLIGYYLSSGANSQIVVGNGLDADLPLTCNQPYSLAVGFKSTVPTFFVGQSSGLGTTGKVGIGNITDPQVKLHILSDVDEAAELKLEHRTTGANQIARIYLGSHKIEASSNSNINFYTTNSTRHFNFYNGTIRSVNGSAAAPAYSFSDNNNTGMFKWGTNSLAFSIGGTQKVAIASEGLTVDGSAITSLGYKVNQNVVINSNRDYNGGNGTFSGVLSVAGSGNSYFNGNVGIGTTTPGDYKLAVKGNIRAEEVVVELMDSWPDYVFEADYPLMQLDELQSFISENNHLPDVPNAEQVAQQGINLGEMNALLLKKVEELTLYILKQDKRLSELETMITGKAD